MPRRKFPMLRVQIPVIGFVAPSGSGKTTLLKELVPVLAARGVRIGYLKHAHHRFDLDVPGKDSYEIRAAGAAQTLLASKERWALQSEATATGSDPSLEEMVRRFDADRLDIILVEGFKHAAYPKIEVHRPVKGEPPLYLEDPQIIAVATDADLRSEEHPPRLPLGDPQTLADFVQDYLQGWSPPPSRTGRAATGDEKPRIELVLHYRRLRDIGCNESFSGSASLLSGDSFLITPDGACADTLAADGLVICPLKGSLPSGLGAEAPVHRAVYRRQPLAKAMLHTFGPYSMALSFAGQDFHPRDAAGRNHLGEVPVLSVADDEYEKKAPEAIAAVLAERRILMVCGRGVFAWGETLDEALRSICALEHSAKTYAIARQANLA